MCSGSSSQRLTSLPGRIPTGPQSVPILYNGTPLSPQNCSFALGDLDPHLIHGSLGPLEPTTQAASRSVQPYSHKGPHSVPILYNGTPLSALKIAPFPWGDLDPHLIHDLLGPPESTTQTAYQSVEPFLQGSLV